MGQTFLVERCLIQKKVYAMKHLKMGKQADNSPDSVKRLNSVLLEIRIMCHPPFRSHPNILSIQSYGWNMQPGTVLPYIIVEYSPHGTVREYVKTFEQYDPDIYHKQILFGDVAMGLQALHLAGIVHGDMKLDNVLVLDSWDRSAGVIATISDFGHSLFASADASLKSLAYHGTPVSV